MFQPLHAVSCDPHRNLIRITLSGLFTVADVDAFRRDLIARHAELTCPPNQHVSLCQLTSMKIQPQEVVAAFAAVAAYRPCQSGRMAIILGRSLTRLQLERVFDRNTVRIFSEEAQGEAWLFTNDD